MFFFLADVPPSPTPEEERAPSPPPAPAPKAELEPASTEVRADQSDELPEVSSWCLTVLSCPPGVSWRQEEEAEACAEIQDVY